MAGHLSKLKLILSRKKKIAKRRRIEDVKRSRSDGNILSLRGVEYHFLSLSSRARFTLLGTLSILLIFSLAVSLSPRGVAESAAFYPSSCLGGWTNGENAQGKPDITDPEQLDGYTRSNSAVLPANTSSDIYCGKFIGDIPKDSTPTSVTLSFSWNLVDESKVIITGDNFASSTTEILDASNTPSFVSTTTPQVEENTNPGTTPVEPAPVDNKTDQSATDNSTAPSTDVPSTETTQPQVESIPTPEPVPVPATDNGPQSFLDLFVDRVLAEEMDSATQTQNVSVIEASTTQSTTTIEIASTTETEDTSKIFEVLYTFDGSNWLSLGKISASELHYAKFEIPLAASSTWSDLSSIQVQIKSLPHFDSVPAVYLDGIILNVSYNKNEIKENKEEGTSPDLYMKSAKAITPDVNIQLRRNDGQEEAVLSTDNGNLNGLIVYASSGGPVTNTYVNDSKYILQAGSFPPGDYIVIVTNDISMCNGLTIRECENSSDFRGEATFSVTGDKSERANILNIVGKSLENAFSGYSSTSENVPQNNVEQTQSETSSSTP